MLARATNTHHCEACHNRGDRKRDEHLKYAETIGVAEGGSFHNLAGDLSSLTRRVTRDSGSTTFCNDYASYEMGNSVEESSGRAENCQGRRHLR